MTTTTSSSTTPASYPDRVLGCLLGTLAGEAYGIAVRAGTDPAAALAVPSTVPEITQLTLYGVDGLVEALEWANDGVAADETACLWLAYLRWLALQGVPVPASAPAPPARWLDRQDGLVPVPAPDADTVRALGTGEMGSPARPLNPGADGPGALLRSAPFGLVPRIPASLVEKLTRDAAGLTHGAPGALDAAAHFSGIIRSLVVEGHPLERTLQGLADAAPQESASRGGSGPTAAGTLAAAVDAVRAGTRASTVPAEQFTATLAAATVENSDATPVGAASLAGAVLGASWGTLALPSEHLHAPGVPAVVRNLAEQLLTATTGS